MHLSRLSFFFRYLSVAILLIGSFSQASLAGDPGLVIEDQLIGAASTRYAEGVKAWRAGDVEHARSEWDAAIDTLLEAPVPVLRSEKLTAAYRGMIDGIAEYMSGVDGLAVKIPEQIYTPSDEDLAREFSDLAAIEQTSEVAIQMNPHVRQFLHYYTKGAGRTTLQAGFQRSASYRPLAEKIFKQEGVPVEYVWLAQVESGWRTAAVSPVGASGVWQLMPATGQRFGLKRVGFMDERLDFAKATRAAAQYLRWLSNRYNGNWELAVAAYNCGEGNMDRAIARAGGVRDFWTLKRLGLLPRETSNYVPAVLATIVAAKHHNRFELD